MESSCFWFVPARRCRTSFNTDSTSGGRRRALEDTVNEQPQRHATRAAMWSGAVGVVASARHLVLMLQFDEASTASTDASRPAAKTKSNGAMAHYEAAIEQLAALRTSDARAGTKSHRADHLDSMCLWRKRRESRAVFIKLSAARETGCSPRQSMAGDQVSPGLMAGGLLFVLP